jgi:type II secretion system protein J
VRLLPGVTAVSFRFMTGSRQWVDRWPAETQNPAKQDRERPAAVEVTLELTDWGQVRRLVEVSG